MGVSMYNKKIRKLFAHILSEKKPTHISLDMTQNTNKFIALYKNITFESNCYVFCVCLFVYKIR